MTKTKIVHLAIDVQERFYCHLPKDRRDSFVRGVRSFAKVLRQKHNVPTIWVAYRELDMDWDPFFAPMRHNERQEYIKRLGLNVVAPRKNEPVFIKNANNAFHQREDSKLLHFLKENRYQSVIVTGMNSCACVPESMNGAARLGLSVCGVYDHMADACHEMRTQTPSWHRGMVIRRMTLSPAFPATRKSDDILDRLEKGAPLRTPSLAFKILVRMAKPFLGT